MNREKAIVISYDPDLLSHTEAGELATYLTINQIQNDKDSETGKNCIYLDTDPAKADHGKRIWIEPFRKCFTGVENRLKGGDLTGLFLKIGFQDPIQEGYRIFGEEGEPLCPVIGENAFLEVKFSDLDVLTTEASFASNDLLFAGRKFHALMEESHE